eukprot:3883586-Pleurochrysis_carterae.AAC.1
MSKRRLCLRKEIEARGDRVSTSGLGPGRFPVAMILRVATWCERVMTFSLGHGQIRLVASLFRRESVCRLGFRAKVGVREPWVRRFQLSKCGLGFCSEVEVWGEQEHAF